MALFIAKIVQLKSRSDLNKKFQDIRTPRKLSFSGLLAPNSEVLGAADPRGDPLDQTRYSRHRGIRHSGKVREFKRSGIHVDHGQGSERMTEGNSYREYRLGSE